MPQTSFRWRDATWGGEGEGPPLTVTTYTCTSCGEFRVYLDQRESSFLSLLCSCFRCSTTPYKDNNFVEDKKNTARREGAGLALPLELG